ncbi:transcription/translation regulatory transformer protein RfaH [Trinickia acidisoli]|uniref:transcription/translation regulatory transformer protein RfaH n=1 Tax=Trinickia acidisoli TaxID=2767482 RepID=UPI001A8CA272|nr:transcription/translation regulatory transformer protein RfaH [Trinickia acidisoli]
MNWYLVHTRPRQEGRAVENLERQGYRCYLPLLTIERIRRGKQCVVVEPMFARYLFIELDDSGTGQSWAPIRSTKGVSRLVMFGGRAAKVEEALISVLRAPAEIEARHPERLFTPGERVRMVEGAFAGIEAVYQMSDGNQRAMVLIELLSRPVRLTVPIAQLTKA